MFSPLVNIKIQNIFFVHITNIIMLVFFKFYMQNKKYDSKISPPRLIFYYFNFHKAEKN